MRHIYLDLDRTLLNTDAFTAAIQQTCQEVFAANGVSAKRLQQEYARFCTTIDTQRYYRLFDHLASFGISRDDAISGLLSHLTSQNFLYPDAVALLDFLDNTAVPTTILTFGEPNYQQFKIACVPRLKTYVVVVIQTEKPQYLKQYASGPSLLVDDRRVHLDALPPTCQGVLIDRQAKNRLKQTGMFYTVGTLEAVKELIS